MSDPSTVEKSLFQLLDHAMQRDRQRLGQALRRALDSQSDSQRIENLARWKGRLDESVSLLDKRRASVPELNLDQSLPIAARAEEIGRLIRENQVVIVAGETGSGKSTQLPLIALQAGFGQSGMIGHTQPRRIAARSVAARVADQLGQQLGQAVASQVRFNDQSGPMTLVKIMTDGILLAETRSDRFLDKYDLIIVDEAHERSLNVDFVLAWLRQLIDRRPNLRVVITSATLDTERFAEHFSREGVAVPVVHVEGRTFPVDILYQPPHEDDIDGHQSIVSCCSALLSESPGDILVFLPTESEIRAVAKKLRGGEIPRLDRVEVLPLYGRLADNQQAEIFRPHSGVRIVLATNVAESSITVPGIRYVVDVGTARISRYAPRSKVQRLPIEPVSQASAKQRAGRCGRVGPGVCVRLYSEEDFQSRPDFTTPEIRRTNLAATLLKLADLGVKDIDQFPLIDPPQPEAIRDGYGTLFEIGATDDHRRLTKIGRQLAHLPVDPRIGRIILGAAENQCVADMLVIAASLETQDVRVRPIDKKQAADEAHAKFNDEAGDFMSLLKLWDFIHKLRDDVSRSRLRKALEQNFLSPGLVHEWQEVHRQLLGMIREQKIPVGKRGANANSIHQSLLYGFMSGVAMLDRPNEYLGAGGVRFHLWPGSSLFSKRPRWIIAGEIVETSRRYGRMIAPVDPAWIEPIAGHLLKYHHVDPFWSDKSGAAMVYENVSLFGLPVITRRRVGLGTIDPETSRQMFIDEGLVNGNIRHEFGFHKRNLETMQLVGDMAKRLRERQLIVDARRLELFYLRNLPQTAIDVRSLRELMAEDPGLDRRLDISVDDLGVDSRKLDAAANMPARVELGSLEIPVEYAFEPGDENDGASIKIPVEALGQLDQSQMHWLVPQMMRDRVVSLIRSLPKPVRRLLIPATDVADRVLQNIPVGDANFSASLARELTRVAGQPVSPDMFDWDRIEAHLMVNVQVTGSDGEVIASARSITDLNRQLGPLRKNTGVVSESGEWNRDGLKSWDWNELPEKIQVRRGQIQIDAFPAIVAQEDSVGLRLMDSWAAAEMESRRGLNRLFQIANRKLLRSQVAWLPGIEMLKVRFSRWVPSSEIELALGHLMVRIGLLEEGNLIRSKPDFEKAQNRATEAISVGTQEIATWFPALVEEAESAARKMESMSAKFGESVGDIRNQFQSLLEPGFLQTVPWNWLKQFPRYLKAIGVRLEKLPSQPPRSDGDNWRLIERYMAQYREALTDQQAQGWYDPELTTFRWMIEEFRVSRFAQQLGTSVTVSEKRLDKQWQSVRRTQ